MPETLEDRVSRIRADMDAADESLRALESSLSERFVPREEIYQLFRASSEDFTTGLRRNMYMIVATFLATMAVLLLCILRFSTPIPSWPTDFPMCVKVSPATSAPNPPGPPASSPQPKPNGAAR